MAAAAPRLAVMPVDDPRWAAFVAASTAAGPFHHPRWAGSLARAYRWRAFALASCDAEGRVLAGAPFLEIRTPAQRRRWVSLPFTDECPPLAADAGTGERFVAELGRVQEALRAPCIEIRADVPALGWRRSADAVVHVLELEADLERVRSRFSRSRVIRNIARAEREGVTLHRAASRADLDGFYALHCRTRRRQGVPVQPPRFFEALWRDVVSAGLGSVLVASHGGAPVAAALFLHFNMTTVYKFGASDPEGWPVRPNHLLFWTAIRESVARGDRRFDFGRTDLGNAGLRAFKGGWGAIERPLVTSALRPRAGDGADGVGARALSVAIRRAPTWFGTATGRLLYRYAGSR